MTAAVTPIQSNNALPDLASMPFHPDVEKLSEVMSVKAQNSDKQFFRVAISYYMAAMASTMRAAIQTPDNRVLPVNMYAIGLAPSGSGKGLSTGMMEQEIVNDFREIFTNTTIELMAEMEFPKIATKRATRKGTDPDDEMERIKKEWKETGEFLFSFDSGTKAALLQSRHKLKMAISGALNLQVDEIGDNLLGNKELLPCYLELYDTGQIKQKLVKNTSENVRFEDLPGITPANMLLFGTPTRLFDGGKTENEFFTFLETGYARRSFFAFVQKHIRKAPKNAEELYKHILEVNNDSYLDDLREKYAALADSVNVGKVLPMSPHVFKLLLQYRLDCENKADALAEHEDLLKTELTHRYSKVMKLAGAYAFLDEAAEIEEKHLFYAIRLAEESGKDFYSIVKRDKSHVRLAKYLAGIPEDSAVTHADIVDDLPFYPQTQSKRADILQLAIGYGYRNNIIIKKSFDQGIEFLHGESLEETNLQKMMLSYSSDIADGYQFAEAPWDKLHNMTQQPALHWINHNTDNGHRSDDHIVPGFNLIVFDIDGTATLDEVNTLLKDFTYLTYTTKRHGQDGKDRFRLIFPTNYILKLSKSDYLTFMESVADWLPFEVDSKTFQRSRKWLTNNGTYHYNEGKSFDVIPFIPRTERDEQRKRSLAEYGSLDALERWVLNNTGDGNRNNQLLRYALLLLDLGHSFEQIRTRVLEMNERIQGSLSETEVMGTIMVTVSKKMSNNQP